MSVSPECRSIGDNELLFSSNMFSRFSNLTTLLLDNNLATVMPSGVFNGLSKLEILYVMTIDAPRDHADLCTCVLCRSLSDIGLSTIDGALFSGLGQLMTVYDCCQDILLLPK